MSLESVSDAELRRERLRCAKLSLLPDVDGSQQHYANLARQVDLVLRVRDWQWRQATDQLVDLQQRLKSA